ncbi:MAG: helix-turn-helix transcriptional regulator [Thermovirgaceae bacterium]|nr:helix-turn-helix transcriptional regulator [Thermovirgaceae bacterium]
MKLASNELVGRRLKESRKECDLIQEQVADFLGVTREYISMIETGKRSISGDYLLQVANLYGKNARYFIDETMPSGGNGCFAFRSEKRPTVEDLKVIASIREIGQNYALFKRLIERGLPDGNDG